MKQQRNKQDNIDKTFMMNPHINHIIHLWRAQTLEGGAWTLQANLATQNISLFPSINGGLKFRSCLQTGRRQLIWMWEKPNIQKSLSRQRQTPINMKKICLGEGQLIFWYSFHPFLGVRGTVKLKKSKNGFFIFESGLELQSRSEKPKKKSFIISFPFF